MNEKSNLNKAFLETTYRVFSIPNIDIRINKLISELNYLDSWAFLTAWNPLPVILSQEENEKRNQELKKDIKKLKLNYINGIGISEDQKWSEESFLIENCTEEQAEKLAAKYGQLAFVFGEKNNCSKLNYTKSLN